MKNLLSSLCLCLFGLGLSAQTFTETRSINCGDMVSIGPLGYPTWNEAFIVDKANVGYSQLVGDLIAPNQLEYTSAPFYAGLDTVVVKCAHATQITCDTGIYIFEIACPQVLDPAYFVQVPCHDSIYVNNLSGWWSPQILEAPQHGSARIILEPTDGAGIMYTPDPGFEGMDVVLVSLGGAITDTVLYVFQVYCDLVSGTQEQVQEALPLFPNPAEDYIYFVDYEAIKNIQLFDALGRFFPVSATKEGSLISIATRNLPAGAYFLSVDLESKKLIGQFIRR